MSSQAYRQVCYFFYPTAKHIMNFKSNRKWINKKSEIWRWLIKITAEPFILKQHLILLKLFTSTKKT